LKKLLNFDILYIEVNKMIISNLKVYDLEESLLASGYAMRTELDEIVVTDKTLKRAKNLTKASNGNGAHG
jgi:hypothetical protein